MGWPQRETEYLHKYINALHRHGYLVHFTEELLTDYPDRPAHYVRTIRMYQKGNLVYKDDGLSNHKLLMRALDWAKNPP